MKIIIIFVCTVFFTGEIYAACGTVVSNRKAANTCGGSSCLRPGAVIRMKRNSSADKNKKNTVPRRKKNVEYYDNSNSSDRNFTSPVRAENVRRLAKLKEIHRLQEQLLTDRGIMTEDEQKEIRQKIVSASRPMRSKLGALQDYPYFSEVTTLDKIALSLVGKKSAYSEPGMSSLEILHKIQKKQYDIFESSLLKE